MAEKEKQYMPQSGAGLMRFQEDDRTAAIQLKKEYVVAMCVITGGALLALRFLA
jgi:preprotein translocase subunit Sec61beta